MNTKLDYEKYYPKLYNVVKYWNELLSAEKNYIHNKLVSSAVIRSQNAKIKNKIKIHFAFSERPDPHQLKFVQFFSTQPISTYFTLQRYIALIVINNHKHIYHLIISIVYWLNLFGFSQKASRVNKFFIGFPLILIK